MRNVRLTVLMRPEEKMEIETRAASRGLSGGAYVRLTLDSFEKRSEAEESDFAALLAEAHAAIPKMRQALERSISGLDATHRKVDALLRDAGPRA